MNNMALPAYYMGESRLAVNPFHIYSYHPQNSHLLTLWTVLCGSSEASYLLIWGFFSALLVFMYGWLSRVTSKTVALCIVVIFVSSQLGFWFATMVKNDLHPAIFLVLQWWALHISFMKLLSKTEDTGHWLFLTGLMGGIALGHKFTSAPAVFVTHIGAVLFFLFYSEGNAKARFRQVLRFQAFLTLGLLIAWGPWLIRNFLLSGNPIYPFLNILFHTQPLYPWHEYPLTNYSLFHTGIGGVAEYIMNLTKFVPIGHYAGENIWWGPTSWLCLIGIFCVTPLFPRETRWVCAIGITSWIFSLLFAIKPPYHAGSLIFLLCFCGGMALYKLLEPRPFKLARFFTFSLISLDFLRSLTFHYPQTYIPLSLGVLISGSPLYHYISTIPAGTPNLASIEELEWTHYLINKYTPKNDGVLFVGSLRPAGIERKHYSAFCVGKQPILYFAEKSKDALDLKNMLLALGIRHIVLDPSGWEGWKMNTTVDGPHNIPIRQEDVEKINLFFKNHLEQRFSVPSGKLQWFSIRSQDNESFPTVPADAEDIYHFASQYLNWTSDLLRQKKIEPNLEPILHELIKLPLSPKIRTIIRNNLGSLAALQGNLSQAIEHFTEAIQEDPLANNPMPLSNRARMYESLEKPELALNDWNNLIHRYPDNQKYISEYNRLLQHSIKTKPTK